MINFTGRAAVAYAMNTFTFSKTDAWFTPRLAPTTIIIEAERFDIDLRNKCGQKINGFFTAKGEYSDAYKPKADSGYDPETEVIVVIGELNDSVMVGLRHIEHYVFKLTDWMRVYEIGKAKEPIKRPEYEPTRGMFE